MQKLHGRKLKEGLFVYLMLAYPLLQFLIFYVGVNFNSVLLAFKKYDGGIYEFLPLSEMFSNFRRLADSLFAVDTLVYSTVNSVKLYLSGLLIGTPLNIIFAYCIYKKVPAAGFFRVILFLPAIISNIVLVLAFKYFVEYGIPYAAEELFGKTDMPILLRNEKTAFPLIIFFGIWSGFGSALILYTNAMSKIPESLVEYGRLEGMGVGTELRHLVFPFIYPTLTTYLVVGIAGFFTGQGAVFSIYGADAEQYTYTLGYFFFIQVIGEKSSLAEYPFASAAGIIFTLIATPLTLGAKYLLERFGPSVQY